MCDEIHGTVINSWRQRKFENVFVCFFHIWYFCVPYLLLSCKCRLRHASLSHTRARFPSTIALRLHEFLPTTATGPAALTGSDQLSRRSRHPSFVETTAQWLDSKMIVKIEFLQGRVGWSRKSRFTDQHELLQAGSIASIAFNCLPRRVRRSTDRNNLERIGARNHILYHGW